MSTIRAHYVAFGDSTIHYKTIGDSGDTLVFIHGWCCSTKVWRQQLSLSCKYRLVLIDLPGHGSSPHQKDTVHSLEGYANAVHAVLQHANATAVNLIAHSMGGPVGIMLLRLHPAIVKSILFVDSFFRLPEAYMTRAERRLARIEISSDIEFEDMLRKKFCSPYIPSAVWEDIVKLMVHDTPADVRLGTVLQDAFQAHALRKDECFPDVAALHICTDKYSFIDVDWQRLLPRCEIDSESWSGHGHFFFLEDPQHFNAQVEAFLDTIRA